MSDLIRIENIPEVRSPYGPYVPAIVDIDNRSAVISGRIAAPPAGEITGIAEQTYDVMRDMHILLGHIGIGFERVTQTGVYLADPSDEIFDEFNAAYGGYLDVYNRSRGLPDKTYPTRFTVGTALLKGASVELVMSASLPPEWSPTLIGGRPVPAALDLSQPR